jgi:hypothetical protein
MISRNEIEKYFGKILNINDKKVRKKINEYLRF